MVTLPSSKKEDSDNARQLGVDSLTAFAKCCSILPQQMALFWNPFAWMPDAKAFERALNSTPEEKLAVLNPWLSSHRKR